MKKGDSVKVKKGVVLPDFEELNIEGWQGRIIELDNDSVTVELDSITLDCLSSDYIRESIIEGYEYTEISFSKTDIDLAKPRDTKKDTILKKREIQATYSFDESQIRIQNILQSDDLDVNEMTQKVYLEFLKREITRPCLLTGTEDFSWEEPYVIGGWSKKEYEELKLTQPSYTDKYELIAFLDEIDDWRGILVEVKRVSDKQIFELPLWDLEVLGNKSPYRLLISDYSFWMTNYR